MPAVIRLEEKTWSCFRSWKRGKGNGSVTAETLTAPSSAAEGGWSSGMLRLGRRGAKRLSAVEVAAERAFSLEIVSDCCRMRFSLPAGESVVRPDMAGEAFSFSVNVGEEALSALTAIYSMNA